MSATDAAIVARWTLQLKTREGQLAFARRQRNYWSKRYHTLLKAEGNQRASRKRRRAYRMLKKRQQLVAQREREVQHARAVIARHQRPPLRERAFAHAVELLGIREHGANNRGADVEKIIRANGGTPGEPWCGDFVAYVYLLAGAKTVTRAWAAVRLLERLLTRVTSPKRGHVVIYQWNTGDPDHTGLFDEWIDKPSGIFHAIEGNTGPDGAVSDGTDGTDGVRRRIRNTRQVQSWRRVLR